MQTQVEHLYRESTVQACSRDVIAFTKVRRQLVYEGLKRLLDIIGALAGVILTLPLLVVFGLLIKVESRSPVIYRQLRVGQYGRPFIMYKLRSMDVNAEKHGPQWAVRNDPRVTRVGGFIRKSRIDEIPQFINVLKGEMSLVGPRPERPNFTLEFNKEIPGFINRLRVKPGLTGWAQVNGGYEISPRKKWVLDMGYIDRRSLWLDIRIILETVKIVFTGHGAR